MNKSILNIILLIIIAITLLLCIKNFNIAKKISFKITDIGRLLSSSPAINNTPIVFNPQGKIIIKKYDAVNRDEFLKLVNLNIKNLNVKVLEIGPYYGSALKGENVKYFDVIDKAAIINKAIENKVDYAYEVPDIDYVEPNGDMSIIKEKFDVVYSSHNIEHQVDLIKHLNQISELLNDNGYFYLIIPDRRYCFDYFTSETPLSEVIATHIKGDKIHSLQNILTQCEAGHNDAIRHWQNDHGEARNEDLNCYKKAIAQFESANGNYIDYHKWRFTPYSFEFIINSLKKLGYISLEVKKISSTPINSQEFNAILYKPKK